MWNVFIQGYKIHWGTVHNSPKKMTDRLKDFVIENPTLIRGQIYDWIKQEILSGNISPGSRVLEGRLAKQVQRFPNSC